LNSPISKIEFQNFRGLPNFKIRLKKPNLLLHAGNGKGKTSIVQGIEWLYGGSVSGLEEQSLKHVAPIKEGAPCVQVHFAGNKGNAKRVLSSGSEISGDNGSLQYIESHPSPNSFILRRSKLLEFMEERPVDRYQRFIKLMGLEWLNDTQEAVIKASEKAKGEVEKTEGAIRKTLQDYPKLSTGETPRSLGTLIKLCNEKLKSANCKPIESFNFHSELNSTLENLEKKKDSNRLDQLIKIGAALSKLYKSDDLDWEEKIKTINETRKALRDLQKENETADQLELINYAHAYFEEHTDLSECPVCKRAFDINCSYGSVFENLERRENALKELRDNTQRKKNLQMNYQRL
jgi:hypothetical protein